MNSRFSSLNTLQVPGVPWPTATAPQGPGGHNNFSDSALAGLLILILPIIFELALYFPIFSSICSCFQFPDSKYTGYCFIFSARVSILSESLSHMKLSHISEWIGKIQRICK